MTKDSSLLFKTNVPKSTIFLNQGLEGGGGGGLITYFRSFFYENPASRTVFLSLSRIPFFFSRKIHLKV